MKNIVITGATSFIAKHLIEELSKEECNIYAIVRENSSKKDAIIKKSNIRIIELNMGEISKLPNYISEPCDVFYHFAWNGTRGFDRNDKKMQNQNIEDSFEALETAKKLGCTVFFTAGSQAEYGIHSVKVNEETDCKPDTEYGKAKLEFYKRAQKYCLENNIKLIEPRFFSIYGPYDYEKTLIISTIKKMINNEDVNLSKCTQLWNFLNVKDAVKALIKLIDAPSGVYNLGSNDTRVLKDYIYEIKNITNSKSKLLFDTVGNEVKVVDVNPDISKIINTIDWEPNYTFERGIKEIIEVNK